MTVSLKLYVNTPAPAEAVKAMLTTELSFRLSEHAGKPGAVDWLVSNRRLALVSDILPGDYIPDDYPQDATVTVRLDPNKQTSADEFLLRVAGDLLQRFEGDAVLMLDTGETVALRRGETVWIEPDPFTREHLFAGTFRPAKLILGLPPPAPTQPDPWENEDDG